MDIGIKTFAAAVQDMRSKQKAYFKSRDPMSLDAARKAEKLVDGLTSDILHPKQKQGSLI